jgi:hypothetical protein
MSEEHPEPESASPSACLNCGEKLLGDFCWRCGQEATDLHRPLRQLAADFLDGVLNLDSKLLRTVGPLLFRPGRLTREYVAGRRAPYVRPLRLYLLAALLSFGVLAIWPQRIVRVVLEPPEPERGSPTSIQNAPPQISRGLERALADQKRFGEAIAANLQRAFFLLLPVFALLLKLVYLRRGILYLDHLVFALHYHAFTFVILTVMILAGAQLPPPVAGALGVGLWTWTFVYLLLALRTAYGGSWLAAGLRFGALMISYGIVFSLALIGLMMLTAYRFT